MKVRQEIKLLFIIQEHFGYSSKVKLEIKSCLEFLINNSFLNTNYGVAIKFGNIFRFIDNLIAINYGNEFENHYSEIYPLELILKN